MAFFLRKRGKEHHRKGAEPVSSPSLQAQSPVPDGDTASPASTPNLGQNSPDLAQQAQKAQQDQSAVKQSRVVNLQQYPWSQRRLTGPASPFPRYGHSTSTAPTKSGLILLFAGLKEATVKNDLWAIESETFRVRRMQTTGDVVSPRYGHASELAGNLFVVFGGDTRHKNSDKLDDNLYFLNISSFVWTKLAVTGPRPCGRFGHSLSQSGSRIYVFGGQADATFFNDLYLFNLHHASPKWEQVHTESKAVPQARSGHSMVVYNGQLYLHGGTNGQEWFNDTWCFDPSSRTWTELSCLGYVPKPCDGHRATVVGEFMYIFGGRSADGLDTSSLASLRLSSFRWYTFQNMGPAPSPRSGHVMCRLGSRILTLGGKTDDDMTVHSLDTTRIRYPTSPAAESKDERGAERVVERVVHKHRSPHVEQARTMAETKDLRRSQRSPQVEQSLFEARKPTAEHHRVARDDYDMHMRGRNRAVRVQRSTPDLRTHQQSPARQLSPLRDIDGNEIPVKRAVKEPAKLHHHVAKTERDNGGQVHVLSDESELERLRRANRWFETELVVAREAGFLPSSSDYARFELESAAATNDSKELMFIHAMLAMRAEIEQVRSQLRSGASDRDGEHRVKLEQELATAKQEVEGLQAVVARMHAEAEAKDLETHAELENLRNMNEQERERIVELESQLDSDANVAGGAAVSATEYEELKATLAMAESRHEEQRAKLEEVTASLAGYEEQSTVMAELETEYEQLKQENVRLTESLRGADTELAKLRRLVDEYEDQYNAIDDVRAAIGESTRRADMLERQVEMAKTGKAAIEQKLRDSRAEVSDLKIRLESAELQIEELTAQNEELGAQAAQAKAAVMSRLDRFLDRSSKPGMNMI